MSPASPAEVWAWVVGIALVMVGVAYLALLQVDRIRDVDLARDLDGDEDEAMPSPGAANRRAVR